MAMAMAIAVAMSGGRRQEAVEKKVAVGSGSWQ